LCEYVELLLHRSGLPPSCSVKVYEVNRDHIIFDRGNGQGSAFFKTIFLFPGKLDSPFGKASPLPLGTPFAALLVDENGVLWIGMR